MTPSGTLFFNRMTPKVAFCHDLLLPKCRREGRIGGMETKVITFRCPEELLNDINAAAKSIKRSRSTVLVAALRLFSLRAIPFGIPGTSPCEYLLLSVPPG